MRALHILIRWSPSDTLKKSPMLNFETFKKQLQMYEAFRNNWKVSEKKTIGWGIIRYDT